MVTVFLFSLPTTTCNTCVLQKEQAVNEIKIIWISAGGKLPQKRRKYNHLDYRLHQLKDRFMDGQIDVMKYVDAKSHLIDLE